MLHSIAIAAARCGWTYVLPTAMMLVIAVSVLGAVPADATPNHESVAMLADPDGPTPGRYPALAMIAEAGPEAGRGTSPCAGKAPFGGAGCEPLPPLSYLLRNAAADTALKQTLIHTHRYPRDPHLRLNHGHAPPRG